MENKEEILMRLYQKGYRRSKSREVILSMLRDSKKPIPVQIIGEGAKEQGMSFNKTTIYRELEKLKREGYVRELLLQSGVALYEISGAHHHHLMCTECGDVRHIALEENLRSEEERIAKKENFVIQEHSLEFFGVCEACRISSRL